jgi:hypothetical protein
LSEGRKQYKKAREKEIKRKEGRNKHGKKWRKDKGRIEAVGEREKGRYVEMSVAQ